MHRTRKWLGRVIFGALLLGGLFFLTPRLVSTVARNGMVREVTQTLSGHPLVSSTLPWQLARIATQVDPQTCANWLAAGRLAGVLPRNETDQNAWDEFARLYWNRMNNCQVLLPLDVAFWLASGRYFEAQRNWPAAATAYRLVSYLPAAADVQTMVRSAHQQVILNAAEAAWQVDPANAVLRQQTAYYRYAAGAACDAADLLKNEATENTTDFWRGLAYRASAACAVAQLDDHRLRNVYLDGLKSGMSDSSFLLEAARYARRKSDAEISRELAALSLTPPHPLAISMDNGRQLAGYMVDPIALADDPSPTVYLYWTSVSNQVQLDSENLERVGKMWIESVTVRNDLADGSFEWDDLSGHVDALLFQPLYDSAQNAWQRVFETAGQNWIGQVGLSSQDQRAGIAWRPIEVTPGHVYLMAGRIHGPASAVIGCQWLGDNVGPTQRFPYIQSGVVADAWIQAAAIVDVPAGAKSCRFVVINASPGTLLAVDDLLLIDITRLLG